MSTRISVDHDRCEGHGVCAISAPEVFSLNDDGIVEHAYEGGSVPESMSAEARFAVGTCPVAALRLE